MNDKTTLTPVPGQLPTTPAGAKVNETGEAAKPEEFGGQKGPEPTRFGDWEKNGRCTDF